MDQFKTLAVGVDLLRRGTSAGAEAAISEARWLAERTKANMVLYWSTHGWAGDEADGRAHLESVANELAEAGVRVRIEADSLPPWLGLIRRALQGDADMVFSGRRSTRHAGSHPLGFNTRKLLRKCPAPVWAVAPRYDWTPGRVLAATDLSAVGDEATRLGAHIASLSFGELHIVHAWQRPFELQMERSRISAAEFADRRHELEEAAEAAIENGLGDVTRPPDVSTHLHCNTPHRAILDEVERIDPDLLVMGTLSQAGIAGLLMGHTAERILGEVECSLLAVKPTDFESPVKLESDSPGLLNA